MDSNTLTAAIRAFGLAVYNMPYDAFLVALDLEDDTYAQDKYADVKRLARAMAPLSDKELARLAEAYQ